MVTGQERSASTEGGLNDTPGVFVVVLFLS